MSKYSDKLKRMNRDACASAPQEPVDAYSIIPDFASRVFFRAKAAMYGMTTRKYNQMDFELSPYLFKRLLKGYPIKFLVPLGTTTAEACGELVRDIGKGMTCRLWTYSVPIGGRLKVVVFSAQESHVAKAGGDGLWLHVCGNVQHSKPLTKNWLKRRKFQMSIS